MNNEPVTDAELAALLEALRDLAEQAEVAA